MKFEGGALKDGKVIEILNRDFVYYNMIYNTRTDLQEKFGTGRATFAVLLLTPDGEMLRMIPNGQHAPAAFAGILEQTAEKYKAERKVTWSSGLEAAVAAAKSEQKLVVALFIEPGDKQSEAFEESLNTYPIAKLQRSGDASFIRTALPDFDRKSDLAKQFKVKRLPTLVIYDPVNDKVITTIKDARAFPKTWNAAVKKFEKSHD